MAAAAWVCVDVVTAAVVVDGAVTVMVTVAGSDPASGNAPVPSGQASTASTSTTHCQPM